MLYIAVGALVSVDAFHSVGVIPVDVKQLGVDFLTGGVLKWLCGGPGGCFLYVAPAVAGSLTPALTGWQAHARPFAFEPEMTYADDAFRWLTGTPVIPALYAAVEGPRIVKRAGVERIRAKSMRQTARLIELDAFLEDRLNSMFGTGVEGSNSLPNLWAEFGAFQRYEAAACQQISVMGTRPKVLNRLSGRARSFQ